MIIDLRFALDTYLACDCDSILCTWLLFIVIISSWLSMWELSISEETLMMPSPWLFAKPKDPDRSLEPPCSSLAAISPLSSFKRILARRGNGDFEVVVNMPWGARYMGEASLITLRLTLTLIFWSFRWPCAVGPVLFSPPMSWSAPTLSIVLILFNVGAKICFWVRFLFLMACSLDLANLSRDMFSPLSKKLKKWGEVISIGWWWLESLRFMFIFWPLVPTPWPIRLLP